MAEKEEVPDFSKLSLEDRAGHKVSKNYIKEIKGGLIRGLCPNILEFSSSFSILIRLGF